MQEGREATNLGGLGAVWFLIFNLFRNYGSLGAGEEQARTLAKKLTNKHTQLEYNVHN